MSFWNQLGFCDPTTELAGQLYAYHDLAMVVVVMILLLVGWFLVVGLMGQFFFDGSLALYVYRNETLEVLWTTVPAFILIALGYVSLKNLYEMEVGDFVDHTLKVVGHQWYWEYFYEVNFGKNVEKNKYEEVLTEILRNQGDFKSIMEISLGLCFKGDWFLKYDSYIVPEAELVNLESEEFAGFRGQSVNRPCFLACNKKNEVLVSTADVMHSWGVSELGVKADAVPGRVNSLAVEPMMCGFKHGNCYELCGEGHSQMPIVVSVLNYMNMIEKLKSDIMITDEALEFLQNLK